MLDMSFYYKKKYTKIKPPLYKTKTFKLLRVLSSFNFINKVKNTQKALDKKPTFLTFKGDKVILLYI